MKKILFPTDFSDVATNAFIYALNVANLFEAQILTLHVYQNPEIPSTGLSHTINEFLKQYEIDKAEKYRNNIPPLRQIVEDNGFDHLEIRHRLEKGPNLKTILAVAAEEEADMIIMGTTGAGGMKGIIGSVAGNVMEHASCPVLAVPRKAVFDGTINKIAYTTSFKKEEEGGLRKVIEMAKVADAELHCVNVDLPHTESYLQRMTELATQYQDQSGLIFKSLDGTDIKEVLTNYLEEEQIDILAMVTHKRNFFQELFQFSKAKMMTHHTRVPILALPLEVVTA